MTTSSARYPQRVRNELRFRELTVLRVERISAGFQRIVLGGEALDGFTSLGFDDHTKVFFPEPGCRFTPRQSLRKALSGGGRSSGLQGLHAAV
ncbi:siderophore-interacting protein [Salmonella enterica subsp. enterica serovar Daytona]|uniref:Siderophore-interacting protein n=1 Tax=Salmonella enterica subsp. enterica serovar Daytona TaxID=1962639 RepID=A0A447JC82_SALET|nr:siderophore-interacting protein [Salmonella enterica subsp. enterica serovar Daytona]